MRLGGPIFKETSGPEEWIAEIRRLGYHAASCPLEPEVSDDVVAAYASAAKAADIVISETGGWSNPISPDESVRRVAMEKCVNQLALADRIGARCCVNIGGSLGEKWDGPFHRDLTADAFDIVVQSVRQIIDAVKPVRTFYTLETMPWMFPDSPDSYRELIEAIDRKAFAVHLDPFNMLCTPRRCFDTGAFLRECFEKLGPYIKCCHAKDVKMGDRLTLYLEEVTPGNGCMDFRAYVRELGRLDPTTPVMIEHLANDEEYARAFKYISGVATEEGVPW